MLEQYRAFSPIQLQLHRGEGFAIDTTIRRYDDMGIETDWRIFWIFSVA
ncbi:hypothetical protein MITSMUL_03686 [Mitsuokella multacida DSM 20544]|uniref:Uncharacterized protein n=1 Tax=Mitsuokella multacida DSM 20544 TaxID=500635 RepID=C9KKI7_9FIRM|nr:hypothetical protein MITSMUL_03686 [Mitsuokella multacida DSM 20544]